MLDILRLCIKNDKKSHNGTMSNERSFDFKPKTPFCSIGTVVANRMSGG